MRVGEAMSLPCIPNCESARIREDSANKFNVKFLPPPPAKTNDILRRVPVQHRTFIFQTARASRESFCIVFFLNSHQHKSNAVVKLAN